MGISVLSAVVLFAVLYVTRADPSPMSDGFSMQYFIGTTGPYKVKIEDADLTRSFEDMCDVRTLVHNRTFDADTGSTLSFKTKRIIEDSTVYYNIFSCQMKETFTLSCRRMDQKTCDPGQLYYEFRSIRWTPANCRCVGICFYPDLINIKENDYLVPQDISMSQCEDRRLTETLDPTGDDGFEGMYPPRDDMGLNDRDHRVDARIPIIIGAVLGAVVLVLLVAVMLLIVSLKRAKCSLNGNPLAVPYVMFPEPEKKPISSMAYPPIYADVVENGSQLPKVEESKMDLGQQAAPATYI